MRNARMRDFKMHNERLPSHCAYFTWIPNSLSCRVLLALALFCTAGIGASPLSFAAEESGQPTGQSAATSPQKEPEPTQRPLERLIMGATPEEHARLEGERERLSAAAAKFGTDPTAVIGFNQLTYNHLSFTNGVRVDSAVATVRVPLTPNYFVQVAMPYAWADSNQSNAFPLRGAGDMIMRMGGRIYSSENIALFVGADVSFPTASETQLGTGKYMIGPGGGVAVPLARLNSLFLLIATENHSIGGDPSRNDVHFTRIQPGKQCDYVTYEDCLQAVGTHGGCEINPQEDKTPPGTAPFCLVTSAGSECIYESAPACRLAASIQNTRIVTAATCRQNPSR